MDYDQTVVETQQDYSYSSGPGVPPSVPRGWSVQWADRESTWLYINQETGEQSWDAPAFDDTYQTDTYQTDTYQTDTYQQDGFQQDTYQTDTYQTDTYQTDTVGYGGGGFSEDAAAWAGNKVGDAEYDVDRVKDDVEDAPEDVAGWVGDKVGGVERFGDEIDGAYDAGRAEGRDGW